MSNGSVEEELEHSARLFEGRPRTNTKEAEPRHSVFFTLLAVVLVSTCIIRRFLICDTLICKGKERCARKASKEE